MNRTALLTACSFAKVFIDSADRELRGGSPEPRQEAAEQLAAALSILDTPYNPDIHRSSLSPYPEEP